LVLVRAIGAQPDGSFIGEVFGLDPQTPLDRDGIRLGDQVAFERAHVFACEPGTERHPSSVTQQKPLEETLRHADHLKEEFIATLSHDGRNPLAPIASTVRFLQAKVPQDLKFAVDLLERQTNQVQRVVNALLDLARAQSGTLRVTRRRVDLAWVLHSAIEDTRHLFDVKRQQFADAYPQQRIELEADSDRLAQVVANLLNNASKYTPAGGRIELVVERRAEELLIRVTDSGIGIPKRLYAAIFEPFVQGKVDNEGLEGLGIGLALAKRIVELHDGHIEVSSGGPGKGSEFLVRLPHVKPIAQA
jgi:two-component system CheB/CheR fusion protein